MMSSAMPAAANAAIFVHLLGAFQVWMQPLYGAHLSPRLSCTCTELQMLGSCPPWIPEGRATLKSWALRTLASQATCFDEVAVGLFEK